MYNSKYTGEQVEGILDKAQNSAYTKSEVDQAISDATSALTPVDLSNYYTSAQTDQKIATASGNTITAVEGKGYATTATTADLQQQVNGKQATLVSGTNIKTINNESILGEGNITIQGGGSNPDYIKFADPVAEQICVTYWGDGTGVTISQLAQVTDSQLAGKFMNQTNLRYFPEFKYFTGIQSIPNWTFGGTDNTNIMKLEEIYIPYNVFTIGYGAFQYCEHLDLVIPPQVYSIDEIALKNTRSVRFQYLVAPPAINGANTFAGCKNIIVPQGALQMCMGTTNWPKQSSVPSGEDAFNVCGTDLINYFTSAQTNTYLSQKQATLVSGTNIKTINNTSLLGSGNIDIGGSVDLTNYYTSAETENRISVATDKIVKGYTNSMTIRPISQADYNNLSTKDNNTLYIIT